MSDHPELLKQLSLQVIDGIALDAVKMYTDGNPDRQLILLATLIELAIARRQHPIHLQWVPSHVDLPGNEVVDDLSKAAASDLWIRKITWSLRRLRSTPGLKN
ncbi:RNase H domain-containing protein [Trichonephila clavipes]|nr:RNase H domain-containing protein [Trichonephila clavipes]